MHLYAAEHLSDSREPLQPGEWHKEDTTHSTHCTSHCVRVRTGNLYPRGPGFRFRTAERKKGYRVDMGDREAKDRSISLAPGF